MILIPKCIDCGEYMQKIIDRVYDPSRHVSERLYYCPCTESFAVEYLAPVCVMDDADLATPNYHYE